MTDVTTQSRSIIGEVISNKMADTVVVQVVRRVKHAVYGKYILRRSKLYVHDKDNRCNIGDKVKVEECRPISKKKRWMLVDILEQREQIG